MNVAAVYGSPRHHAVGGPMGVGLGSGPSPLTLASLHYSNTAMMNHGHNMLHGGSDSSSFRRNLIEGDEMSEKEYTPRSRSSSLFNDRRGALIYIFYSH